MTFAQLIFGAVLVLFAAMLPALTTFLAMARDNPGRPSLGWFLFVWRLHLRWMLLGLRGFNWRDLVWSELGVVNIVYTSAFAGNGGSVAPTAVQARALRVQTATVSFIDTDTQAVIVHNMGAAGIPPMNGASFASFNFPIFTFVKLLGGASETSFATDFTFGLGNSNSITVNKISVGAGSGGTWLIQMLTPGDALL